MKAKETRDSLQVVFVQNLEAMSTIFQNKNIKNDFDEALVDYVKEEESFSKS